jgi:ELWxxDGT repeat protein
VQVWRWDGSNFPGFPLVLPDQYDLADNLVSVGDVTGDGVRDLVLVTKAPNHGPALVHVIDPRTLSRRMMRAYSVADYHAEPALADLDGDGTRDIVVQTERGLDAWRGDGTPLPGFPVPIGDPYYGQKASGDPVVGDVDGDQRPDIVLVAKSADLNSSRVHAYDAQGRPLPGFPKLADSGWDDGMPAIADIDRDGRNEIIDVGQRLDYVEQKPTVWVWDLGGGPSGPVQWGQHKGGPRHEGVAGASTAPPQPAAPQGVPATGTLSLVADIAPGGDGSAPRDVVPFRGSVAFSAWRPDVGRELFVSDGTAAGTRLVADIASGPVGPGARELAVVGEVLFFVADDGVAGAELWRSDGTAAGTRRVADVRPGQLGSRPEWVTALGTTVYFSADDGTSGRELWSSDGTAAGTRLVADLKLGRLGAEPKDLVVHAGSLYFLAYNQYLASGGYIEARQFLQRLDEGGQPVFYLNAVLNSGAYGQPDYAHVDWAPPLLTDGRTIWSVAGAGAQRTCTVDGVDAEPFFAEVAQTAAAAAGAAWTLLANCATPLAPLPPPGGSTYLAPRGLAVLAAATWFAGTSATTGRELWSSDGTAAGTRLRTDLRPGAGGSDPADLTADRIRLLVSAGADSYGREPWQVRPDGMAARIADLWPGPGGSSPRGLVRSGMRWYFVADDPEHGGELWSVPIETVAPTIAATVPALVGGTLTATVTAADDLTPAPLLALRCRVDTRDWAACGPTYTVTGLSTGGHTFTAQAIDQSGNVGTWTATFRSDVTPPAVPTFTAPTATTYLASPVTYSYQSTDVGSTVASYDLRYRTATPTSGFPSTYSTQSGWTRRTSTSVSVALSPGQEVCVSARARDAAGNVSAWSADRCTGMPIDDRSLSASSGWTRVIGTAFFRGTATTTRTYAAMLSKGGITARRIAIVATTCPTCGSVSVYLGGGYVGSVSLTSSTTGYRRVLALPMLTSARTGTLVVRTRSSAFVAIDGVSLRRT